MDNLYHFSTGKINNINIKVLYQNNVKDTHDTVKSKLKKRRKENNQNFAYTVINETTLLKLCQPFIVIGFILL